MLQVNILFARSDSKTCANYGLEAQDFCKTECSLTSIKALSMITKNYEHSTLKFYI